MNNNHFNSLNFRKRIGVLAIKGAGDQAGRPRTVTWEPRTNEPTNDTDSLSLSLSLSPLDEIPSTNERSPHHRISVYTTAEHSQHGH